MKDKEIPHMSVTLGKHTFDAPVALLFKRGKTGQAVAGYQSDKHGYIYALPGGGRINSNGVVL